MGKQGKENGGKSTKRVKWKNEREKNAFSFTIVSNLIWLIVMCLINEKNCNQVCENKDDSYLRHQEAHNFLPYLKDWFCYVDLQIPNLNAQALRWNLMNKYTFWYHVRFMGCIDTGGWGYESPRLFPHKPGSSMDEGHLETHLMKRMSFPGCSFHRFHLCWCCPRWLDPA